MVRVVAFWVCLLVLASVAEAQLSSSSQSNRARDCPVGKLQCGIGNCCSRSQRCSWDGFCIPPGGSYCGGGRTCAAGQVCVNGGLRCAPKGSSVCSNGKVCLPGTVCGRDGSCIPRNAVPDLTLPGAGREGTGGCLPGGGCSSAGWFQCEETESQCRPGFKCSRGRGCVPVRAVDCGQGKWCKPGEICTAADGCAPDPDAQQDTTPRIAPAE